MSSFDPHQRFEVRAPDMGLYANLYGRSERTCSLCVLVFRRSGKRARNNRCASCKPLFLRRAHRLVLADERSAKVLPRLVLDAVAVGADFESAFTTAPSPCPACASEALVARRALKALRDGLDAQTGRSATPTDPLCPKHLRALLLSADRRSALRLARRGGSHFRSTDRVQTVLRLAIGGIRIACTALT